MNAMLLLEVLVRSDPTARALRAANRGPALASVPLGRVTLRPWVAQITGYCARYGLARDFLRPMEDRRHLTRSGRGLVWCYVMPPGVYEVSAPVSRKRRERYFARSVGGELATVTLEEVHIWLGPERSENAA